MKKPLPLTAMSSELPVVAMLPWPNCWAISDTATPLPVAMAPCWVEANRSANSVREPLKPVVATLARLLEVTDRSSSAALSPVRAMLKDMESLLLNVDHGAQRHGPVDRVERESLSRRIDGDALHLAVDQRGERLGRTADRGADVERVLAGRRGAAARGGA